MSKAETIKLTQEERTAISDEKMLNVAIEIILKNGVDQLKLKDVGEQAGYSRGLAHYRFKSKAGLFSELMQKAGDWWVTELKRNVKKKVGFEALVSAMDAYLYFLTKAPDYARILHILRFAAISQPSNLLDVVKRQNKAFMQDAEQWIIDGIKNGSLKKTINPHSVAAQYVSFILGHSYIWLVSPESVEIKQTFEDYQKALKHLLMNQKS